MITELENKYGQRQKDPECLRVAYAIQNVGGIDLHQDVGDAVPVKYTIRGLQKAGHHVICLMLSDRSVLGINDLSHLENAWNAPLGLSGTRPFRFIESGIRRIQSELGLPYFALFDLYRFYEACFRSLPEFTLCHEHNGLFCAGAALACWRLGIPYVLTFSADPMFENDLIGTPLTGPHALVASWEASLTYKVARKIICVSEPAKTHLIERWRVDPEKVAVLPNGVDIGLFNADYDGQSVRARLGLEDADVVCFVGGFQPWHGLDLLVESFVNVRQEIPNAKLLLIGDGRARSTIDQKISDLGLDSVVIITGFVPQTCVPEILAAADVAVLPYPRLPKELWFSPLKLYEYMAAGKAIVASRSGQIADVIQDGLNGLLVEPGDVDDLARAIIRLLKSPSLRAALGQNARNQAVERHSWDQYTRQLEEIYLAVLEQ
jgi:glycosyltransferase involved in cell wall biosynthesis